MKFIKQGFDLFEGLFKGIAKAKASEMADTWRFQLTEQADKDYFEKIRKDMTKGIDLELEDYPRYG